MKSDSEVTLTGTAEEMEAVEAMLSGTVLLGNPPSAPLRTPLYHPPNLEPDPEEARFFPPNLPEFQTKVQVMFGPIAVASHRYSQERVDKYIAGTKDWEASCIGIYVHGLAGYGCGANELLLKTALMKEIGFEQMRSPRGSDGKYWEVWYLAGAWAASGPLKEATLAEVVKFVAHRLCPGSIDLVRQHLALGVD